jgi:hypothetical protein
MEQARSWICTSYVNLIHMKKGWIQNRRLGRESGHHILVPISYQA